MQAEFKIWMAGLACSALVLIVTPPAIAQASSKATLREELTKEQNLVSEGSQKVTNASKKLQEAVAIIEMKRDYPKARQMITDADKTMAGGVKQLTEAQKLQAGLLQDIRITAEADRKMMEGAKLMRKGMAMMMRDEKALSAAHKITREGQGMLERGQKLITTPQL